METLKAGGAKMAVISNKQDSAVRQLAAQHFRGLLDFAVGESETVRRKPNPDAVLAALRALNAEPGQALYIGDTEVDLATAKNAGLPCASVGWGFRTEAELKNAGAAYVFPNVEELRGWLMDDRA
jgi:phosphoglycolate phosphatase